MSKYFSGALKLENFNDYLSPSQECTKLENIEHSASDNVKIHINHDDGTYYEENSDGNIKKLKKTKISLNDCLACSGCVTTAETILIEAQSSSEFLLHIKDRFSKNISQDTTIGGLPKHKLIVVSISPQVLASFSALLGCSMKNIYRRFYTLFIDLLHCDFLFDTNFSRNIALLETYNEFLERYRNPDGSFFPMISSCCPGWIFYAEKTHGEYILPYLSHTKSPQQIMGTLVKTHLVKILNDNNNCKSDFNLPNIHNFENITISDIYLVEIMPCYDKKLEAIRPEFFDSSTNSHDVDLVLTSSEIANILEFLNLESLDQVNPSPIKRALYNNLRFCNNEDESRIEKQLNIDHDQNFDSQDFDILGFHGSSGSFAEYVFKRASFEIFGKSIDQIEFQVVRNQDFKEIKLVLNGNTVLLFAVVYGFRNIQTIVSQIKKKNCKYHFIEIMACPSGCLNGGGQLKPHRSDISAKQFLLDVQKSYVDGQVVVDPQNLIEIQKIYNDLNAQDIEIKKRLFTTKYRSIENNVKNVLNIQW